MDAQRRSLEDCEFFLVERHRCSLGRLSNLLSDLGLDDLCVRFIVNLPQSELSGFDRIGTHVEEAHWFYEDFIRPLDPSLPSMNLRHFSLRIFQRCPLTAHCGPDVHERAYAHWIGYKKRIPVRGAILLNEAMDSVLLVRGWDKGAAWMFPRGKINQGEDDLDCAIREVYEETGFNAREMGLIPENRALKSFEMSIRDQHVKLFVIPNVPMNTVFQPRTRKEIGKIQWYKLADLPGRSKKKQGQENTATGLPNSKFYMVASFSEQLRSWIKHQIKKRDRSRHVLKHLPAGQLETEDALTEEEGMTTEAAIEPPPVFATAESHEAATRELHRLLKIQPPAQRPQAEMPPSDHDKGQALLAMLRQTKDIPPYVQAMGQPNSGLPHTPMEHLYNVASEPRAPHHHHQTQRLPPEGYQVPPPTFPVQPDINDQLRSFLGLTGASVAGTMQQSTQIMNQQVTATTAYENVPLPSLLHPQPLPRQANHILTDAVLPLHPTTHNHHFSGPQQLNAPNSYTGGVQLPQQLVANLRQPPTTLDNTRLALLNAFKTESGPVQDTAVKTAPHQKPLAETYGSSQQQHENPASLGLPYGLGTAAAYPGLAEQQGSPLATPQRNLQTSANLRPQSISQNQQKALLDIFKQPAILCPSDLNAQPNSKENGAPRQVKPQQSFPSQQFEVGTSQPMPPNHSEPMPYGPRSLVTRPKQVNNAAGESHNQSQAVHTGSHIINGLAVSSVGSENKTLAARAPSRDILLGSPYTNQAQLGLAASPGSLNSIPHLIPRHHEADPQQVQRLMSLFSKSAVASSDATVENVPGKGKEPALCNARLPQPSTHAASMVATQSMDGRSSAHSMSRRGSQQAPISPENEKFLLNYLKTVSSGAK